jgi:hypothetical protein
VVTLNAQPARRVGLTKFAKGTDFETHLRRQYLDDAMCERKT